MNSPISSKPFLPYYDEPVAEQKNKGNLIESRLGHRIRFQADAVMRNWNESNHLRFAYVIFNGYQNSLRLSSILNFSHKIQIFRNIYLQPKVRFEQQFPLDIPELMELQSADPLDCDKFMALAMDEEQYKGCASVTIPERDTQRELLGFEIIELSNNQDMLTAVQPQQELVTFDALKVKFMGLCQGILTNHSTDSYLFSLKLSEAEQALLEMEETHPNHANELQELKVLSQRLYDMIPQGKSVVLNRDLEKLGQLYALPTNETYESSFHNCSFYEPKVTVGQLSTHFERFARKWNYVGISTHMKTNYYYTRINNESMQTTITFVKKEKTKGVVKLINKNLNMFLDFLLSETPPRNEKEMRRVNQLNEARTLVEDQLQSWGFEKLDDIGFVCSDFKEFNEDGSLNTFGCYLILSHKKVKTN